MSKTLKAMWTGIALLIVSWMFPPSEVYLPSSLGGYNYPATRPMFFLDAGCRPFYGKLAVIDAVIVTLTAGAMVTLSRR